MMQTYPTCVLGRLSTASVGPVSASFGTGKGERAGELNILASPDMWFDIRETSLSNTACVKQAEVALKRNGFQGGNLNEEADQGVIYGYTERFVGAIWCGGRKNLVLISV